MTTRKNTELTPEFLRKVAKNIEIDSIRHKDKDFFMCIRVACAANQVNTHGNFQDKLKEHNVPLDGSLGYRCSNTRPVYLNRNYRRNSNNIRIMFLELLALQLEDEAKAVSTNKG